MMYLCQARVDNLMFNNKRQVSIPLHPKGWSFLETNYMKFCKKENNLIYIFIPSCGSVTGDRVLFVDEYAYLWTSSIEFYPVDVSSSSVFSASGYTSGVGFHSSRYIGYPLRGVMPK